MRLLAAGLPYDRVIAMSRGEALAWLAALNPQKGGDSSGGRTIIAKRRSQHGGE